MATREPQLYYWLLLPPLITHHSLGVLPLACDGQFSFEPPPPPRRSNTTAAALLLHQQITSADAQSAVIAMTDGTAT